jgi:hypothetical protein
MKQLCFSKFSSLVFILLVSAILIFAVNQVSSVERNEINIPDIPGYVTLKCDFHMHTVFSDGSVWPTVRPDEAWREGLDAFSITDHIEYQPHKDDMVKNQNRSYDLAIDRAKSLNLIIIKGTEITRGIPPGHFNAIFIKDVNPLDVTDYKVVMKSAVDQGGFIFWNHPPDKWYQEHEDMYNNGWLHGIEVVNGGRYYPYSHKWCIEKKLTLIGTSDVHGPMYLQNGEHRSMTLVFAKDRSAESIKEALIDHRTAIYSGADLIGDAKYLEPIFNASVEIVNPEVTIKGKGSASIWIRNKSDVPFKLILDGEVPDISVPREITLSQNATFLFNMRGKSDEVSGKKDIRIPYKAMNLITAPEENLKVELNISVNFDN